MFSDFEILSDFAECSRPRIPPPIDHESNRTIDDGLSVHGQRYHPSKRPVKKDWEPYFEACKDYRARVDCANARYRMQKMGRSLLSKRNWDLALVRAGAAVVRKDGTIKVWLRRGSAKWKDVVAVFSRLEQSADLRRRQVAKQRYKDAWRIRRKVFPESIGRGGRPKNDLPSTPTEEKR